MEQISSYLLGELDADSAAELERRLAEDPALRDEVERLRPLVAKLEAVPEEAWEPPTPPPLSPPPERRRRPRPGWLSGPMALRPAPAAGLAALLLALGIAIGALIGGEGDDGPPGGGAELVLSRIDDGPAGAAGRVLVSERESRATVDVSGLEPSERGRFYELWLLDADGSMIALGGFKVGEDGRADVELPVPVPPQRYQYFDISLQEDNGDPTHSGVSVLRGPTSS
jgi:anti-sigma-K factor RskA